MLHLFADVVMPLPLLPDALPNTIPCITCRLGRRLRARLGEGRGREQLRERRAASVPRQTREPRNPAGLQPGVCATVGA